MEYEITLKIDCRETTCGTGNGKFCRFLKLSLNGKEYCLLFGRVYDGIDGWLQRHPDCIEASKRR
jgi:hypothetical protein